MTAYKPRRPPPGARRCSRKVGLTASQSPLLAAYSARVQAIRLRVAKSIQSLNAIKRGEDSGLVATTVLEVTAVVVNLNAATAKSVI